MKILLLTFYFPPDLGAGSFRSGELTSFLSDKISAGDSVTVLTTRPNRYKSFTECDPTDSTKFPRNVEICRIFVPEHSGGLWVVAKAFLCFAYGVIKFCNDKNTKLLLQLLQD